MQELTVILAFAAFVIWFCDLEFAKRQSLLAWSATILLACALFGMAYSFIINGQLPGSGQVTNFSSPYSIQ